MERVVQVLKDDRTHMSACTHNCSALPTINSARAKLHFQSLGVISGVQLDKTFGRYIAITIREEWPTDGNTRSLDLITKERCHHCYASLSFNSNWPLVLDTLRLYDQTVNYYTGDFFYAHSILAASTLLGMNSKEGDGTSHFNLISNKTSLALRFCLKFVQ